MRVLNENVWLIILLLTEDLLNPGMVVPACDCVDSLATLTSATEYVKLPVLLEVAVMPKTLLLS